MKIQTIASATKCTALLAFFLSAAATAQTFQNPHFATPYIYYDSNTSVADKWNYFREYQNPKFQQSDFEQMPGGPPEISCQQIWADWSAYKAGIYQQVTGCTVGDSYHASGWCISIFRHGEGSDPLPGNISQKLGMDPYGGTNPLSSNVVWGPDDWKDRGWRPLNISAVARSSTITVFARTYNVSAEHNCLSFYDSFNLIRVRNVSYNRATIEWETSVAGNSRVDYGLTSGYGNYVQDPTLVTHHSVTLTNLSPGATYHFKASYTTNGPPCEGPCDVIRDSTFTTMDGTIVGSVEEAKRQANGARVIIPDVSVIATIAQLGDKFYVAEPDNSCGIRVSKSADTGPANIGDRVDVNGTLSTTSSERYLSNARMAIVNPYPGQPALPALSMNDRAVGGGRLNDYTPGVADGTGTNNIGLLTRIWGKVTKLNTVSKYFYVDDGSGLLDGSSYKGVRVSYSHLSSFTPPAENKFVVVTAIISTQNVSGNYVPRLLLRQQSDLVVF